MLRIALGLAAALVAAPAAAADKLAFGPPPAWVKPAGYPKPAPLAEDGPAVRLLRIDQQLHFGREGDSIYHERVAQVRTSLGLTAVGTISLAWNPGQETLTVHKVRIVRDGKPIDVLARQQFSVIRREANLNQIVDGQLTATLQPEDLRVGDILEVAYTLTRNDPVMGGRTDMPLTLPPGALEQVSIRASWPSAEPIAWRAGSALPAPKVTRRGGTTELTLELKKLEPVKVPTGAPRRYWPARELEFSEFRSWGEVAAQVAAEFEAASRLTPDSPLREEARKIAAASADPEARASAALKLVQEQVRYLGLILQDGGYTPVAADETWRRRFGECKAKSVLLVALLRELGIKAEPALVNAQGADGLDRKLPRMSAFNHVIVRAEIDGKVYWLDGTRTGDENIEVLDVPGHDWALPVRAEGAELIALVQPPRKRPDTEIAVSIDATAGIEAPAPVKGTMIMRGDRGLWPGLVAANMPPAEREKMLKALWSRSSWIEVKNVSLARDGKTGESRITMDGVATLRWSQGPGGARAFTVQDAAIGHRADFKREPGPNADAPFAVPYPSYTTYRLTLKLPHGGEGFAQPAPDVDQKVAGRHYRRRTVIKDGTLTIETSVRALAPEFPAAEAPAAAETLTRLASERVVIQAPRFYRATDADVAAWTKEEPKTAAEFVARGAKFGNAGRRKEALADFEKAIALDPKFSAAYASRGLWRVQADELAAGKADLEKAAELDPRNAEVQRGLGMLALRDARYADAVTAFTRAADLQPNNIFAVGQRAQAHRLMGEFEKALADYDEMLRMDPGLSEVRIGRAEVFLQMGDRAGALAEVDQALAAAPQDPRIATFRAGLLAMMGRRAEAEKAFAASLAMKPTAEAYLTRARHREDADVAGKLADIAAAEKLEPDHPGALRLRAQVLADSGKAAEALALVNRRLKAHPDELFLVEERAAIYAKSGQAALAAKDFAQLRAKARDAEALNALCWGQATLGVALETALADCEKALAMSPKAAHILDSKAFVLMRLGRLKEALETYDAALSMRPKHPESLYGRGLTKLRLGLTTEGESDLSAATAAAPLVADQFADYGLKPDRTAAQTPAPAQTTGAEG